MSTETRPRRTRPGPPTVCFEATTVTGTEHVDVSDLDATVPAGHAAQAIAARLDLPQNIPWALRDESSGHYLEDHRPIGEQIDADAKLRVTPKTHLG